MWKILYRWKKDNKLYTIQILNPQAKSEVNPKCCVQLLGCSSKRLGDFHLYQCIKVFVQFKKGSQEELFPYNQKCNITFKPIVTLIKHKITSKIISSRKA